MSTNRKKNPHPVYVDGEFKIKQYRQFHRWQTFRYVTQRTTAAARPLSIVFRSALQWFQRRHDHYSWWGKGFGWWQRDSRELFNLSDQIVTRSITGWRKSFYLCRRQWGKGGQLASAIRQLSDKQYITVRDSQTNERGSRNVHPGQTQFYNQPGTLITLYSGWHMHSSPHVHCLPHQHLFCHLKSQRNDCHVKYYPTEPCESMINQTDSVYS